MLPWTPQQQGRAYRLGSRFWALYVGLELGWLGAELFGPQAARGQGEKRDTAAERAALTKNAVRNMAWAPLTLHWSTEKGLVSDGVVGLLGSIPGVIQMRDLWRQTAQ